MWLLEGREGKTFVIVTVMDEIEIGDFGMPPRARACVCASEARFRVVQAKGVRHRARVVWPNVSEKAMLWLWLRLLQRPSTRLTDCQV